MLLPRRSVLLLPVAIFSAHAAEPAGPRQNLLVELRWVDSSVSGAVLEGMRQGAVVVGTAGSVSPRAGGTTLSTRRREDEAEPLQRLVVLNGYTASVLMSRIELLQWVEAGAELESSDSRTERSERSGAQDAAGSNSSTSSSQTSSNSRRQQVRQRSLPVERKRGFALTPHWPGGRQPVRVDVRALNAGAEVQGPQTDILSTVQVALGDWITVARSGAATRRPEPGVLSSSDAELQTSRELQLRVSLAP